MVLRFMSNQLEQDEIVAKIVNESRVQNQAQRNAGRGGKDRPRSAEEWNEVCLVRDLLQLLAGCYSLLLACTGCSGAPNFHGQTSSTGRLCGACRQ